MKSIYNQFKSWYKSLLRIKGVKTTIGNFCLAVDPENSQPYILRKYPEHGKNLLSLAKAVSEKYGNSSIFDIGANFGDTAAMLLTDNANYKIICIEGDNDTFNLLSSNFSKHPNVKIHKVFLGDENSTKGVSHSKVGGSLRLKGDGGSQIQTMALDELIKENPSYQEAKLIKIDTDGFDNKILRGARSFLNSNRPVVFFEYDKVYLRENGEEGMPIFDYLSSLGYKKAFFYDNYGRFILSLDLDDKRLLVELDRYITDRKGAFAYYDIAVFHESDDDVADKSMKEYGTK